jgi:hypothetical protein
LGIHALRDIEDERFQGIQGLFAGDGLFARRLHRESFRVHGVFQSHDSAGSGVGSDSGAATAASKACRPTASASARQSTAGVSVSLGIVGFSIGKYNLHHLHLLVNTK